MSTAVKILVGLVVALCVVLVAVVPLTTFTAEVPGTREPIVVPDATASATRSPARTERFDDPLESHVAPSTRTRGASPTAGVQAVRPQPDDVDRDDDDVGRERDPDSTEDDSDDAGGDDNAND